MDYLEVDPGMDSLGNDSGFVTLSRRIGLFTLTRLETHIGQSVFLARGFLAQPERDGAVDQMVKQSGRSTLSLEENTSRRTMRK